MKIIFESERLILREFTGNDARKMFELNSDPEVIKYTGNVPFESVQEAQAFIKNYKDYEKNGFGRWAVLEKKSKVFLGWCGLKLNEEKFIDIGFRFFKKYWNKGYATESAKACLKYGFENLNIEEIIGEADKENIASIKVLKKLGMKFWEEATLNSTDNSVFFRINKKQFEKLK